MQVDLSAIRLVPESSSPPAIRNWALGQLLDATVIARDTDNAIHLRLSGTTVRASTTLPLQPGQNLQLKVNQLSPIVTLSVVNPAPPAEKDLIRGAINRILPMQRPFGPLLNQLGLIPKLSGSEPKHNGVISGLPAAVTQAAHNVLQTIPTLYELRDPNRFPELLRRVGVFSEVGAKDALAKNQPPFAANDLKWQLLRLRGTIQKSLQLPAPNASAPNLGTRSAPAIAKPHLSTTTPTVPMAATYDSEVPPLIDAPSLRKLSHLVDGVIAKIETNQLKAVSALLHGDSQLVLDLPVAFEDGPRVIQLKIAQEDNNHADDQTAKTTVVLQVPINDTETLQAVVSVVSGTLSVRLWSSDTQIREAIVRMRESLVDRLRGSGLEKVNVTVAVIKPFDEWGNKFDQLVDVTA